MILCLARQQLLTRRCTAAVAFSRRSYGSHRNNKIYKQHAVVALLSLSVGYSLGHVFYENDSSLETTSVACDLIVPQQQHAELVSQLRKRCGSETVIDAATLNTSTLPFLRGARIGQGTALCIVTPTRLQHLCDAVELVVKAGGTILVQGQNTGLTGGSVPRNNNTKDTRPLVVISTKHLTNLFPIDNGQRVVCLAGTGLAQLHNYVDETLGRESHSMLGSTFLNPTVAAGVAFGSGGTQLRKGPAYTERALYLTVNVNKWNETVVDVVDALGIFGMTDGYYGANEINDKFRFKAASLANQVDRFARIATENYQDHIKYSSKEGLKMAAHDATYRERLCQMDDSVSRFNADTRGPDPNRSEGKVVILATVHDTFPKALDRKTYWISFDSLETALEFRKQVCLDNPDDLPISMEYMNRDAFDVVDRAGRVAGMCIKMLGTTSPVLTTMWNAKVAFEALPIPGASKAADRFMYAVNQIVPALLPANVMETGRAMDHHLTLQVGEFGDGNMLRLLKRMQDFASTHGRDKIMILDCSDEAHALDAFRFVAAIAFRTWCIGNGVQGISVDYALPKNGGTAPVLNSDAKPIMRMRYSHFGCNVVHEDLAYAKDVDVLKAKHDLKHIVDCQCGGKLPAEHGHGTEYVAPKETQERWKKMDPLNVFNPGIGGLPTTPFYKE
jgi:D-lactate dehydrogenase